MARGTWIDANKINFEEEREVILNFIKHKLNGCEFEVRDFRDLVKTIHVTIYLIEDEEELRVSINRRKDGYRILSMG